MATLTGATLRLPGVYFLPSPPQPNLALPPLDVTGFVGFAERGLRDAPIPIEDPAAYRALFGGDVTLARTVDGKPVYGNLPTAIAGFFANGGRRCYVVRVAGDTAQTAQFALPGLTRINGLTEPGLATVAASSEGVWANRLRIAPRLAVTPLPASAFQVAASSGVTALSWQTGGAPNAIQPGDLLRLTFADGSRWLSPVTQVRPDGLGFSRIRLDAAWRLAEENEIGSGLTIANVQRLLPDGAQTLSLTVLLTANGNQFQLALFGADAGQVQSGDMLQLSLGGGVSWLLRISDLRAASQADGSPRPAAVAAATEILTLPGQSLPVASPAAIVEIARLRLEFAIREGALQRPAIVDAGFNAAQPRFWGRVILLESSALHQPSAADGDGQEAARAAQRFAEARSETRSAQSVDSSLDKQDLPGFAGLFAPLDDTESAATFLPVGMPSILIDSDLTAPFAEGTDGLENYQVGWFFDPLLIPRFSGGPGGDEVFDHPNAGSVLLANAENAYFVQERRLRGLHSLMFVDEVGLAALPDAALPRWRAPDPPVIAPPVPPPITLPPDRTHFDDCPPPVVSPTLSPPVFVSSPAITSPTALAGLPVVDPPIPNDDSVAEPLLNAHRGLIQFCEARQNVVAILSLPGFYEKRQCLAWQQALRQKLQLPPQPSSFNDVSGLTDLSYAAVYHPWSLVADSSAPDGLRAVPPDGIICGMIAARERARQVWVAPANVPLNGVLGLTPAISEDDRADLFAEQFNVLHVEPRDFRVMSAHTLSDERILRQISVRRLLIVLRKAALERGQEFVFQNNTAFFREGVRQTLESLLRRMFAQGAFAGGTPAQSYRIVTDASVNPPQSVDLGRFIVQIQVAPSQPAEFITVLLLRTGDNLLAAER